jgi:hypothetical protein
MTASLEAGEADLVFPYVAVVAPQHGPVLGDVTRTGRYAPHVFIPASSWVMRSSLASELGPWKSFRECYQAPSQNWLYRASRAGYVVALVPVLTVMIFPSGLRKGSYAGNQADEQLRYVDRIETEANFREQLLTDIAATQALEGAGALSTTAVRPYLVRAGRNAFRHMASFVGVPPAAAKIAMKLHRRGWLIHDLRKTRGLPALDSERD